MNKLNHSLAFIRLKNECIFLMLKYNKLYQNPFKSQRNRRCDSYSPGFLPRLWQYLAPIDWDRARIFFADVTPSIYNNHAKLIVSVCSEIVCSGFARGARPICDVVRSFSDFLKGPLPRKAPRKSIGSGDSEMKGPS
jgi:hypothetical protein